MSSKVNKVLLVVTVVVLLGMAVGWLFYECFAHKLVEAMYEGRSIGILNSLIQYQCKKPLEHYLKLADTIFYRTLFPLSAGLALAHILYRLIFSEKRLRLIWLILFGLFVLTATYMLNPNNRVYSNHGFFRAGMVYQILNGYIPPLDPLFAGEIVHSPWGFPWLTAQITRIFNITPSYSFAVINVVSLGLTMLLVYKISQLLIKDEKANILSAAIPIFGTTMFSPKTIRFLEGLFRSSFPESRALPVFIKFSNVNGVPLGLVFFLLFVYAIIKIFENKNTWLYAVVMLASILGCGFFYPHMAPGIVASVLTICVLRLVLFRTDYFPPAVKPVILALGASIVAVLILVPYALSVSSGVSENIELFNLYFLRNIVNYLIPTALLWVIILINRKYLIEQSSNQALVILSAIIAATAGCYLFIHLPGNNEYKFLILSTVTLGILGGIAFYGMKQRFHRCVTLILLLIFIYPSYSEIVKKLNKHRFHSPTYVEKGRDILFAEAEENELYQWIRDNTARDSAFIDLELRIPVFAQRCLFIGMDKPNSGAAIGYGMLISELRPILGYDADVFEQRTKVVENIYGLDNTLTRKEILDYLDNQDIYVVVRSEALSDSFNQEGFQEVFKSSQGHFLVYKPMGLKN